ncbi:MAG: tetratricopeptide repeat protein [Paludibacter sp.]
MKFKIHILISTLLFCFVGCSFIPDELKTAEKLIETAPDSALHILQYLPADRYKSGESRALYGLLLAETLGKKKLPLEQDTLLDFSIDYYTNHPDGNRLATGYLYKGRIYKDRSQYEKAMQYYMKAFDEIRNPNDNTLLGRINYDLGDIYNIQNDYNEARKKYTIAHEYFSKAKFQLLAFYSLYHIGRTYHAAKDYKTAEKYYKKILPQARDSIQLGDLYQEIGLNFYDSHNYDSALYYFHKSIKCPSIQFNPSIRYSSIAGLYFDIKQYDTAYFYASNAFGFNIDFRTQRECYRIMANCEFIKGNTQNVSIYMNKYVALGDSLRKVEAQIKGSYIEAMHSTKKEAEKSKSIIGLLSLIVLLILGSAYIIYQLIIRRSTLEKKQIQESYTEEKVGIHKKVIEEKWAILQKQIEDRKILMMAEFRNAGSQEREQQLRKIYIELLHFTETELFLRDMDKLLNGLITKLKNRYNTLNEKEIMLCCYLLLHIPTYDMLILFDYKSDDSLKSLKRRLPKKIKLENATLLEDFLLSIISEN